MDKMSDEEVTRAPNHLLYTEDPDGMTSCRVGCTRMGCLALLVILAVIITLIALRRTGVI